MVIGAFFLIKITTPCRVALDRRGVINAIAVNANDLKKTIARKNATTQQELKETPNKKLKTQLDDILQKNLLIEQAKEIAALKKAKQIYSKNLAKKRQQQMQQLLQKQIIAEQKQLTLEEAQEHARQLQGEVARYKAMVLQAIAAQWIVPDGIDKDAACQLLISIAPDGVVLDVQLLSSSGNVILDRSAQAAVLKASPLPVPEAKELLKKFRTIKLTVKPEEFRETI